MSYISAKSKMKLRKRFINILGKWFHIRLLTASRFKKRISIAAVPAWLLGLAPKPGKISDVNDAFAKLASATGGLNLQDRMSLIAEAMKGKSFGGKPRHVPYPRLSEDEYKRKLAELQRLI